MPGLIDWFCLEVAGTKTDFSIIRMAEFAALLNKNRVHQRVIIHYREQGENRDEAGRMTYLPNAWKPNEFHGTLKSRK